jgi:hypothetical protein
MAGAYRDLERAQVPDASTATRIAQQVGASFGTAVLAAILAGQLTAHPGAAGAAAAYGYTFAWALAFTALAFVPVLALPGAQARNLRPATPADGDAAREPAAAASPAPSS